jgi:aspartate-semialdehyde dehydrogenase
MSTGASIVTSEARIGVVGATGAVGSVTLQLLAERGYRQVRAFASERSAGSRMAFGSAELVVEEATPESLGAGDLDLCLFSVGTSASRELVPHAAGGGTVCVDKSSAYRLVEGYPLVVPEVNGSRAMEALESHRIVANPNCCTIPLTCVLGPLHERAGVTSVRVATYQSVSGAGWQRMERLRAEDPAEHDLEMDWSWEADESDEESKLRAETRKIMELPDLPVSATCVRVPVLVGHSEAVWVELEESLSPDDAARILREAPSVRVLELPEFPTPRAAVGIDDVLVGRIRRDGATTNGLALYLSSDNLRKGAALNAIQIAELLLDATAARAAA